MNRAEVAVMNPLDRLHDRGERPPLRAELYHAVVLPSGSDRQLALARVVARRLLAIYVLAGRTAKDCCRRVPVVWRGDDQHIDILIVERLAKVARPRRLALLTIGHRADHSANDALIDIADIADLRVRLSQEGSRQLPAATIGAH